MWVVYRLSGCDTQSEKAKSAYVPVRFFPCMHVSAPNCWWELFDADWEDIWSICGHVMRIYRERDLRDQTRVLSMVSKKGVRKWLEDNITHSWFLPLGGVHVILCKMHYMSFNPKVWSYDTSHPMLMLESPLVKCGMDKKKAPWRGVEPRFRAIIQMTGACTNRYTTRDIYKALHKDHEGKHPGKTRQPELEQHSTC